MTPTRERGIGAAVSELFREERAQIRQVIEGQLRGSRPGVEALPALRDARAGQTAESISAFVAEPGATRSGAQVVPTAQRAVSLPPPERSRRGRSVALVAGAGLVAVALVGVILATRHEVAEASGGQPRPAAAVAATATAELARPTPPRPAAAAVRGVTDDSITLGMSAAFSGASRELGDRMKLGIDTAFAVVNEAGGVVRPRAQAARARRRLRRQARAGQRRSS